MPCWTVPSPSSWRGSKLDWRASTRLCQISGRWRRTTATWRTAWSVSLTWWPSCQSSSRRAGADMQAMIDSNYAWWCCKALWEYYVTNFERHIYKQELSLHVISKYCTEYCETLSNFASMFEQEVLPAEDCNEESPSSCKYSRHCHKDQTCYCRGKTVHGKSNSPIKLLLILLNVGTWIDIRHGGC